MIKDDLLIRYECENEKKKEENGKKDIKMHKRIKIKVNGIDSRR